MTTTSMLGLDRLTAFDRVALVDALVDEVEELAAADALEHEAVVRRRAERVQVRHDRRVRDVLQGRGAGEWSAREEDWSPRANVPELVWIR